MTFSPALKTTPQPAWARANGAAPQASNVVTAKSFAHEHNCVVILSLNFIFRFFLNFPHCGAIRGFAARHGLFLAAADGGGKSLVLSEEELPSDALEKRDTQEESLAFGGSP